MRAMKHIATAAVAILTPALFETASAASSPTGIWLDDTGRGAVEIKPCGDALCGNVVWVKASTDASGCGKQIIGGVTPAGSGSWDNGWIYSPERGRKYNVELTPMANGNLKVVGYAGMKFLSKTMIWKPAPQDLQLCGQEKKPEITASTTPPATPSAAEATPAAPAPAPQATAPANTAASADHAPAADANKPAGKTEQAQAPATPSDAGKSPAPDDKSAKSNSATADADPDANADKGGNDLGEALGKLKIGDLSLDKVLTRTKSGKCKLDLPWIKLTLDCEQQ
jgi:uncharacterized protein (DUF2147 family)